ncbi:HAMP domain-containing histidine kinase [Nonomuraea sp. KC401]|nr:sensor histidine kinase [Nonomuraea sp. K271]TLF73453.1 HAMP domain-containing histidine kinase [Nonomuraea sp. KC401]
MAGGRRVRAWFGRSLRVRLALFASIAMLLLNIAVGAFVLHGIRDQLVDIQAQDMSSRAVSVLPMIKDNRLPQVLEYDALDGVQVVDPSGRPVTSTLNLVGLPRQTTAIPQDGQANAVAELCGLSGFPGECKIVTAITAYQPDGDWIIYAFDQALPWYVGPQVILSQAALAAALVALTWFVVWRATTRTLAPVSAITKQLAELTTFVGGMRVPVPQSDDEIAALAETANRTLERLETAMREKELAVERQRRFAADASHDLRSPITAMRAQMEDARLQPDEADWIEVSDEVLASLDRLQAIVADLLVLTRLDAGAPSRREPVELAELVAREVVRPRAKQVVTDLRPDVVVMGDRLQLARLLTNLMDNADRHADSRITVTVREEDGQAVLEVLDDGEGIAPEHREVVFERFARLDAARNRDVGGSGLGLPIAREIAAAHGGTLTVEDSERGARFVFRAPLQDG